MKSPILQAEGRSIAFCMFLGWGLLCGKLKESTMTQSNFFRDPLLKDRALFQPPYHETILQCFSTSSSRLVKGPKSRLIPLALLSVDFAGVV